MSIFESNTVIFHGVTAESRAKIHSFLQGYLELFQKHFGEDRDEGNIYIGGIPTYAFDLDLDYEPFPRDEGYYVMGISPRWACHWGTNPGFVGIFLEQKLCTKITWHQYWDQGEPNRIYMNDSTENVPATWQYYEFVPGEDGVPAEYDEENEDDEGEAFNQYVNEVMRGEREVEWKDGFPDYWHDRYDELESQRDREEMEDFDFDFDADDDEKDESEKTDFDMESKLKALVAQNEKNLLRMQQSQQMKQERLQERLNARLRDFECAMKTKTDIVSGMADFGNPSNTPHDSSFPCELKTACPRCHSPVTKDMRFCEKCGQKL